MSIGQPERATQNRVVRLFREELGYRYLGEWGHRDGNSNLEEPLLTDYLTRRGYSAAHISRALYRLRTEADNRSRTLYGNNGAVYGLLRYGVPVQTEPGKPTETVKLIDWQNPEANDFALAEEVTLAGEHTRRPDVVLYVNGIAVGVLELKNVVNVRNSYGGTALAQVEMQIDAAKAQLVIEHPIGEHPAGERDYV